MPSCSIIIKAWKQQLTATSFAHLALIRLCSIAHPQPSLFLEDLYVAPQARNRGAGKALFRELGAIAEREGCPRLDWNVLEWNEPSIAFYTKVLGAHKMDEWRTCRLEGEGITRLRSLGLDS
ncbi:diamine n-acetyltransferase [Ceraceosorus bombacis]|uniref:Diamine n-acetyltransferase n=1 Tax=Ceraceosorus bombacis TaxID=401625 RepID=A0A0P1BFD6_9BASI|nr:diamine n-acetyltransferase [Ceraceosorus bombacis]